MSDVAGGEFEALQRFIDDASSCGCVSPLFAPGAITATNDSATAAAQTRLAMFASVTESVVLRSIRVGASDAMLAAVCSGNFKDEAGSIAAAICSRALLCAFDAGCDEESVERTLVAALHDAHLRLVSLSSEIPRARPLWTVMAKRSDLSDLGALVTAAVCTRESLWVAHIGDGIAALVDANGERALTVAHTLANAVSAQDRAQVGAVHRWVVLRALGFRGVESRPTVDVVRARVARGSRVVLGAAAHDHRFEDEGTLRATEPSPVTCVEAMMGRHPAGVACACAVIDVR